VLLATVSFADVAADVFGALQALDLDDLDAGPRPGGYVEPSEAAWNMIERMEGCSAAERRDPAKFLKTNGAL
jgi:hypothetical protein